MKRMWVRQYKGQRPQFVEITGEYAGVFICQEWDTIEEHGKLRFGKRPLGGGLQIAKGWFDNQHTEDWMLKSGWMFQSLRYEEAERVWQNREKTHLNLLNKCSRCMVRLSYGVGGCDECLSIGAHRL